MAKRVFPKGAPTQYRIEQGQETPLAEDGILNSAPGGTPKAEYKQASNERRMSGPGGGEIVFGNDRPNSQASGYGAKGYTGLASPGSGKIDLVAGRLASARGGDGVASGTQVDSSFSADAARIYICETTDVDKNFGLVEGVVGNPKGQSAVAIKADQVRMIGRGGMKFVTGGGNNVRGFGPTGETTSKGGKLLPAPGIDFIAGNNIEPRMARGIGGKKEMIQTLQPVTMAYNTRDCFQELSEILDDIMSTIQSLGFYVQRTCVLSSTAFATSAIPYASHGAAAGSLTACAAMMSARVLMPIHQARATKSTWEANYLQHFGYKFIGSRSVRTT